MFEKELRNFEHIFRGITGKRCECFPETPPELGHTDENAHIYVAKDHEYYKGLSIAEQKMFRLGIFTHEMLHQIFSNFSLLQRMAKKLGEKEYRVFAECNNLVEDASIEFMASNVIKGKLLKALQFSIQTIYLNTPQLQEIPSPYQQFICALVQFGDMGILKGDFTFPESKECFNQAAKLFDKAVESQSTIVRKNYAIKIMEIARPLWEKEDLEDKSKSISDLFGSSSKTLTKGVSCCDGKSIKIHEDKTENSASARRKKYLKKKTSGADDNDSIPVIAITSEDLDWLTSSEDLAVKRQSEEKKQNQEDAIDKSIRPSVSVDRLRNLDVEYGVEEEYKTHMAAYHSIINSFSKTLQRIFQNDKSEVVKKKKGKLNIERYYAPRKTPRIFDHRTTPKNIKDMAITIAIDESGSMTAEEMGKKRTRIAKEVALCFAEAFSPFDVPLYVFGYNDDVTHHHYIKWRNTRKERTKLLVYNCYGCNHDAASINYAVELLKSRKEKHKLLIVITDGIPSIGEPLDVQNEVRKARKMGYAVLGVAIGNDATEAIKTMYGKDFFHVTSTETAFKNVAKIISKMIQSC